ncbi:MAG TPA: AsmA-like C-terminal region-containing protein [Candidatus Acidoferrales bacterium]|nr:AsmA-like C-terminal region-containing protein [Candidatus Acidoferrales bacterium]
MELRPSILQGAPTQVIDPPTTANESVRRPEFFRRLLTWAVVFALLMVIGDGIGVLLVSRQSVRQRLNARLEAAFGRRVEVDRYSFSLWGGPTLEADGIRVGEDPRFGHEYFLRADSLAVRLRWLSLLRGHIGIGALSLSGPTVNIVNESAGDWNLAEWLGHPAASASNSVGPAAIPFAPSFREIEVDGGRINFKNGDEKLPFAFINVNGAIYADGPQRWRLDLEAAPWRAAEILQQPGKIHVAGSVGGTSSALRPASVEISWTDAAASDFLRLMTGDDSGIRGTVAIGLNAQTSAEGWAIQGQALLGQLHRWDLTLRPDLPAVDVPSLNVTAKMLLDVPASVLQITDLSVQAPHSNLEGAASILWDGSAAGRKMGAKPVALEIKSASIDFSDVLAWLRAFRQNVPPGVTVKGFARAHGTISGWPLSLADFTAQTYGAELSGDGLVAPLHLGLTTIEYNGEALRIPPTTIAIGDAKNAGGGLFRVEFDVPSKRRRLKSDLAGLRVSGGTRDASEAIAAANAFGWDVARGWQLAGPLHCDLLWAPEEWPWKVRPVGSVTVGGPGDDGASLRAPFLNLPVNGLEFRMDFKHGARHVTLSGAQAFGAHWSGTFDRSDAAPEWQFALSADMLSAADLDRWLDPRWRESFIDRMLPFLNLGPATAVPDDLRGAGRLTVDEFTAAPFTFQKLAGDLTINGRDVTLYDASADLFHGKVNGTLDAKLTAKPNYHGHATFSGIDVGAFAGADRAGSPAAVFSGAASGEAEFSMAGNGRTDFANSLECKGAADVRNATWTGVQLLDSLQAGKLVNGESAFDTASSQFTCARDAVALKQIVLTNGKTAIDGAGTIDFAQRMNLQVRMAQDAPLHTSARALASGATGQNVIVTGTLAAPQFRRALAERRSR